MAIGVSASRGGTAVGAATAPARDWGDRKPWLVATLLAGLGFLLLADHGLAPTDFRLFAAAGDTLLHGHLAAVFADPQVQAGPLALVLAAVLSHATGWLGAGSVPVLLFMFCWINAACLINGIRTAVPRHGPARGKAVLVATAFAVALGTLTVSDAHPTHALIALLWLHAARRARRGDAALTGLLLAVACGLDTWGVLGVGVLLLLPASRHFLRATATTVALTAVIWLPFVLSGSFRSFDMQWAPVHGSLPYLLFGSGPSPWSYRAAQGALAVTAGAVIAWRLRANPNVIWLLPAGVVAVRLMTDPINFLYYDVPLQIMLIVGLATLSQGRAVPTAARIRTGLVQAGLVGRVGTDPMLWAALALLLPPVATLLGSPLAGFAPSVGCLAVLAVLLGHRPRPVPAGSAAVQTTPQERSVSATGVGGVQVVVPRDARVPQARRAAEAVPVPDADQNGV
jgi:hypothetical protein